MLIVRSFRQSIYSYGLLSRGHFKQLVQLAQRLYWHCAVSLFVLILIAKVHVCRYDRLKLSLMPCNKKNLACSISLSSDCVSTAKTSDRYLFDYRPSNLQRLFSFQFCRSLTNYSPPIVLCKMPKQVFGLPIGSHQKQPALPFQVARKTVNGFPITSRNVCAFIFRILRTTESSLRLDRRNQFSLTNSLPPRLFRYRAACDFESEGSLQTL